MTVSSDWSLLAQASSLAWKEEDKQDKERNMIIEHDYTEDSDMDDMTFLIYLMLQCRSPHSTGVTTAVRRTSQVGLKREGRSKSDSGGI